MENKTAAGNGPQRLCRVEVSPARPVPEQRRSSWRIEVRRCLECENLRSVSAHPACNSGVDLRDALKAQIRCPDCRPSKPTLGDGGEDRVCERRFVAAADVINHHDRRFVAARREPCNRIVIGAEAVNQIDPLVKKCRAPAGIPPQLDSLG